jgi:hypothetical protein
MKTPYEQAYSRFPGIEEKVLGRLILDGNLYDTKTHTLIVSVLLTATLQPQVGGAAEL